MLTASPIFGLGVKVTALTAITAILFSASLSMTFQSSHAQFGAQTQEQESQQETGEQQVESDGGLTATLNRETFARGDTVSVSGTVEERDGSSSMYATIIDPDGIEISTDSIAVGSDLSFRYGFVAGEDDEMTKAGTYTIQIQYFPPGDAGIQSVTLDFEYNPEASQAPQTEQGIIGTEADDGPTTIFQSTEDRIRLQVPDGWVVEDVNGTDPQAQQFTEPYGVEYLIVMCPENQALPVIGGLHTCTIQSPTAVGVEALGFADLSNRPEFAALVRENRSITTSDLLAFYIEYLRQTQNPEMLQGLQIAEDTDLTVNVIDSQTNQTVGTAPAKYIEISHAQPLGTGTFSEFALLALNNDTGYLVRPLFYSGLESDTEVPSFVSQVFDSFHLVVSPMNSTAAVSTIVSETQNNATAATTTAPLPSNSTTDTNLNTAETQPPQQQGPPQQQEQSSSPFSEQLQSQLEEEGEPIL